MFIRGGDFMTKRNRLMLIIIQIIIIALSVVQISGLIPQQGLAGLFAACAVWTLVILRR